MRTFFLKKLQLFAPTLVSAVIILLPLGAAVAYEPTDATLQNGGSVNGGLSSGGSVNGGLSPGGSVNGGSGNCGNTDPNALQNPLSVCSISDLIDLLLKAVITIGIPIAVLFIVYAGFKFIMARGSPTGLTEARNNLVATLIGVAIFIGASLIADVIINTLHQLGANNIVR